MIDNPLFRRYIRKDDRGNGYDYLEEIGREKEKEKEKEKEEEKEKVVSNPLFMRELSGTRRGKIREDGGDEEVFFGRTPRRLNSIQVFI